MSIPKNVRDTRKSAGLTQRQLAEASGVSFRTVQYAEGDEHETAVSTLAKLAKALGVPLSVLLGDDLSGEAYRIGAMVQRLPVEDRQTVVGLVHRLEGVA